MIEDSNFKLSSLIVHILVMLTLGLLCICDGGQELLIHVELSLVHALIKVLVRSLHSHEVLVHTQLFSSVPSSILLKLELFSSFLLPVGRLLLISLAHHLLLLYVSLLLDTDRL